MRQTLSSPEISPINEKTLAPAEEGRPQRRLSLAELDALSEDDPELALPSLEHDIYAVHKRLIDDIDSLTEWEKIGLSPEEQLHENARLEKLRSEITINAIDLAGQFLPKDVLNEYNIQPIILDNYAIHHPPTAKEVVLLGTAWDVTGDSTVQALFEASIEEVPEESERKYLRRILREATLNHQGFRYTYVHAEADRMTDEGIDLDAIKRPNAYMALGRSLPVQNAIQFALTEYSRSHDALAENQERLVEGIVPIPDNFIPSNETTAANTSEPMNQPPIIYFPKEKE